MIRLIDVVMLLVIALCIGAVMIMTIDYMKTAKNLQSEGEVEVYLTPDGDVRWRRSEEK